MCFLDLSSALFTASSIVLPDDQESGLAGVDDVPELFDIGPGHPPPQVPAHPADRTADDRHSDNGWWEQDADHRAGSGSAPSAVPGRHLVLVHMNLAVQVLGDDRCVVGPDDTDGVQILDDVVVGASRHLVGVGADVEEYSILILHVSLLSMSPSRGRLRLTVSLLGPPEAARGKGPLLAFGAARRRRRPRGATEAPNIRRVALGPSALVRWRGGPEDGCGRE